MENWVFPEKKESCVLPNKMKWTYVQFCLNYKWEGPNSVRMEQRTRPSFSTQMWTRSLPWGCVGNKTIVSQYTSVRKKKKTLKSPGNVPSPLPLTLISFNRKIEVYSVLMYGYAFLDSMKHKQKIIKIVLFT